MVLEKKINPNISPTQSDIKNIASELKEAIQVQDKLKNVFISLKIQGGVEGERYDFDFNLRGSGQLKCGLDCEMTKRNLHPKSKKLADKQVRKLVQQILDSGVLESESYQGQFIPCTLVGVLEIRVGDRVYQTRFVADEEQAKTQQLISPKPLQQTIGAISRTAEQTLKVKSIKP